ncbi:DUF1775 domain-containing protein [Streptomyces sp. MSC1_001]|jgi:hypothetical protein|uniref:DUF1775 domain-containing protein n=1 Tax=Streptomyces sp. MSC1_001 TaxID=2909263 RepID=UPI00202F8D45|nr:DUF1775 domain-containing protein [Streptomyces sp. MSC1_001]
MNLSRPVARTGFVTALTAAVLVLTGPAQAHVDVKADNPCALATGVTLTFRAAAESDTAGIAMFRVQLPKGIAPSDVQLRDAPPGWTLTPTANGFTLGGGPLPVGQSAIYRITVRQLPAADKLAFTTLQTYSDGRIDFWNELPGSVNAQSPAPTLHLSATDPGAAPASSSAGNHHAPKPPHSAHTEAPATTCAPAPATNANGAAGIPVSTGLVIGGLGTLALTVGAAWKRRRDQAAGR